MIPLKRTCAESVMRIGVLLREVGVAYDDLHRAIFPSDLHLLRWLPVQVHAYPIRCPPILLPGFPQGMGRGILVAAQDFEPADGRASSMTFGRASTLARVTNTLFKWQSGG